MTYRGMKLMLASAAIGAAAVWVAPVRLAWWIVALANDRRSIWSGRAYPRLVSRVEAVRARTKRVQSPSARAILTLAIETIAHCPFGQLDALQ